jgi:hypothetical protein
LFSNQALFRRCLSMAVACLPVVSSKAFTPSSKSSSTHVDAAYGAVDDAVQDLLHMLVTFLRSETDDVRLSAVHAMHWMDARNYAHMWVCICFWVVAEQYWRTGWK